MNSQYFFEVLGRLSYAVQIAFWVIACIVHVLILSPLILFVVSPIWWILTGKNAVSWLLVIFEEITNRLPG